MEAAIESSPAEAKGLGQILASLRTGPFGNAILFLAAAGLLCYGFYCFARGLIVDSNGDE